MIQNLVGFTEEERKKAMERYHVLEPYLKNLKSVRAVSKSEKYQIVRFIIGIIDTKMMD
ncbi:MULTISPECIES: hypothetical protein [Staphylococcus]|uniref:hypothetical protein n=1 Tax=Staphylococcus TaxID=1279 RepID=UPI0021CE162E|nr:hypothetical protein [Staphylococcus sp. IVB6181]UXV34380.1 hypothetical protein MUA90_10150 [Staphylococcus sp. IVB6181]